MIDQLIEAIGDMAQAAAARLAAIAVIGVVMLVGAGFVLASIYMGLAAHVGPVVSALTVGLVLIVLALVAIAIWFGKSPAYETGEKQKTPGTAAPRSEDDMIMDLLIDAARTGFATGQGNKAAMNKGFESLFRDLDGLGVFDRRQTVADALERAEKAQKAAMERAANMQDSPETDGIDDILHDNNQTTPFPRDPGQDRM
ncbi:phage holin family protein [Thalassospira profundimaris]|uniref:phage holin family protein n=1 Tax=Thalassospira profundimaris TaxID=502049 RepID=UPI000DED5F68|nr:phage holin family protein [Thalassospira profundimaris]